MPNLCKYVLEVTNNMAWIGQAAEVVGDTKPWFIHPAGMMGLVGDMYTNTCICNKPIERHHLEAIIGSVGNVLTRASSTIRNTPVDDFLEKLNEAMDFYMLK